MGFQSRYKTWLLKLAVVVAVPALVFAATALPSGAQVVNGALIRLAADFQNSTSLGSSEVFTAATATTGGGGGTVVYTRTLRLPTKTVFVNFSAAGDTHDGAGMWMTALITDAFGDTVVCEPYNGQGDDSDAGLNGWISVQKMPAYEAIQLNCDDGLGGPADCHDNNIFFSCCAQVIADPQGFTHTVDIKLASSDGGTVFYERASINIDAAKDPNRVLCTGVDSPFDD